ncbi:MFS transporter [Castellaniella sp. GW247-6E4]|uniref:CynX/NimT family MFS transporter n=1 Tax=Castellaniella sp. GW247-6E4 TaxID=3140380 RepID=UPI0033149F47
MAEALRKPGRRQWVLLLAILLAGLNMRPMVTSMPAVLDDLRAALDLSPSAAGLLIALPTFCFGAFGIAVPPLLRFASAQRLIVLGLLTLALGIALRGFMGAFGLFAGILISSAGISVMMVLVPAIAKQAFTQRIGPIMSLYTMAFCLGAGMGAGLSAPIARLPYGDWRWGLAVWLLPALAGAFCWHRTRVAPLEAPPSTQGGTTLMHALRRDPLAWQVTLFMGLQSGLGHSAIGWMPAILIDRGMHPVEAGAALSAALMVQLLSTFAVPWLASRSRDQRLVASVAVSLLLTGLMGIIYAPPATAWVWIMVGGLGMGGTFSLGLSLMVLRTRTPLHATALSGMAQGVGYIIAAAGPFLVGVLYEHSGGWHTTGMFLLATCLVAWLMAMGAGRARYVLDPKE